MSKYKIIGKRVFIFKGEAPFNGVRTANAEGAVAVLTDAMSEADANQIKEKYTDTLLSVYRVL